MTQGTTSTLFLNGVATTPGEQEKQGIWIFIFPDMENTDDLPETITNMFYAGNLPPTESEILVLKIKGCNNNCGMMLLQYLQ